MEFVIAADRRRLRTPKERSGTPTPHSSRRKFCRAGALGSLAVFASGTILGRFAYAESPRTRRLLLKGGTVITIDKTLGDFENADVLIEGARIVAVGRNLSAGDATVISASNMIVMP